MVDNNNLQFNALVDKNNKIRLGPIDPISKTSLKPIY